MKSLFPIVTVALDGIVQLANKHSTILFVIIILKPRRVPED